MKKKASIRVFYPNEMKTKCIENSFFEVKFFSRYTSPKFEALELTNLIPKIPKSTTGSVTI
ncbi:hypothetical protein [uncultured Aquimarina sp.]|uniref:hypothetical protein n=1 Tax=uncultured Aquimarina sp. TaxID=575652 RepID=UPI0026336087|nr:hypothetical protein [uncultured Aquimarina sp.]